MSCNKLCVVCEKVATKKCPDCPEGVLYCGAEHQKVHWAIHKPHHGKNEGRFIYPPLTHVEAEDFFSLYVTQLETLSEAQKMIEHDKFKLELSDCFSKPIQELILTVVPGNYTQDALSILIPYLAAKFITENDKVPIVDKIFNSNSARRQILSILSTDRELTICGDQLFYFIYSTIPLVSVSAIANHDDWISTTSTYFFLILNFNFISMLHQANLSVVHPAALRSLWERVQDEVERLIGVGECQPIWGGHEIIMNDVQERIARGLF